MTVTRHRSHPDSVWSKDSDGFMADDLYFYDYLISIDLPWILGAVSLWDRSALTFWFVMVVFSCLRFCSGIGAESLFEGLRGEHLYKGCIGR